MEPKEIVSNIFGDRAKSYLWRSFIASWIFWNWRIIIVLFWYEKEDLGSEKNYINYIEKHFTNWCDALYIPLLLSLLFLVALPFADYLIAWYLEWQKVIKKNRAKKVMDKLYPTRADYDSLLQRFDEQKGISESTNKALNSLQERFSFLEKRRDVNFFFSGKMGA